MSHLKAPFPYFGGKSRVAEPVWQRFDDVPNYVEPFAGFLAILLARERIWFSPNCNCILSIFDYLHHHPKAEKVLCTQGI